jgi:diguanylate cyclase (GGDEF)-like protein
MTRSLASPLGATLQLDRFALRSRFGRRLLLLFVGFGLLPAIAVALLSFQSVREQLTSQAEEQLHSAASLAGRTIRDRLDLVEADLRDLALELECAALAPAPSCGVSLRYGVESLARVDGDTVTALLGVAPPDLREIGRSTGLLPGHSALLSRRDRADRVRLVLVHRVAIESGRRLFVATLSRGYLWSDADRESLPGPAQLTLWDPDQGDLDQTSHDSLSLASQHERQMARSATGAFRWSGADGRYLAAYRSIPTTQRFRLPAWRVVVSEPMRVVLGPMRDFTRTFPAVLAVVVLVALGLGLSQIRRSLIPLEALHQSTKRITGQDFEARVSIASGDEIEELASSFNQMAARLGKQFRALRTAAEIDRAVLSSVDRTRIAETVLTRLPELCQCEAASITLLDSRTAATGAVLTARGESPVRLEHGSVNLTPSDLGLLRSADGPLSFPDPGAAPSFLLSLGRAHGARIDVFPLRFGEELFGTLALRRVESGPGAEADLLQVSRLADQVAVALGNAQMVEQVRFMAFYDSLTGLPNRVLHKERLGQALLRAGRRREHVAVCFLDLDRFSDINDTMGHDLGDRLLEEVATRLRTCCRETDTVARARGTGGEAAEVARLGGDEFTVVFSDLTDAEDAGRVARRLLSCFVEPFRLGPSEIFVSGSIGVAVYPEDGKDGEELLKNADAAMYHAKDRGGNTYQLYSTSMNASAVARMRLEQQLRRAVETNQFTIVYQPIADLETGLITGAEALVRWQHPERGLISPGEFIALSEESGLIVRLGEWILETVCQQGRAWERAGHTGLRLAVNLSARQLQDEEFVTTVRDTLQRTGLDPKALVFELTESVLMEPQGQVAAAVRSLAALGVQFAIDDFGTGYSSLSYLKHFPIGALKIDRSFVQHVTVNPDDAAITSAIVALGRALGIEVVAEGVETTAQANFLGQQGCHRVQGFLIGTPMPPEALAERLAAGLHPQLAAAATS